MGGFLVTYPRDEIRALLIIFVFVRITLIPAALLIGLWFLIQLVNAGAVANVQTGGVAYLAHVGGFIFAWLPHGYSSGRDKFLMKPKTGAASRATIGPLYPVARVSA